MALAADTAAVKKMMLNILEADAKVTSVGGQSLPDLGELLKAQDVLLIAGKTTDYAGGFSSLIRTAKKEGIPVICVADQHAAVRLTRELGPGSVIRLPDERESHEQAMMEKELLVKVKSCYGSSGERGRAREREASPYLVGIGASTGGPKALLTVLGELPEDTCAILAVQHLSSGFSENFAQYLDQRCRMRVKQAVTDETARRGTVYLAAENHQMTVQRHGDEYVLRVAPGGHGYEFCPSVDCLFESMAACAGKNAMGIILTGMGNDGSEGIYKMREAGAYTVCQDRETSDIYSMPKEALLRGGVVKQLPLEAIAGEIGLFGRRGQKG